MNGNDKGKNLLSLILLFVYSVLLFVTFFSAEEKQEVGATPPESFVVVIDAGHGGIDGGAEGVKTGTPESEINLAIAEKLRSLLVGGGIKTVMTRSDSGGLYGLPVPGFKRRDMYRRAEIIGEANPAVVVSVHQNSCSSSSRRGSLVYYESGDEKGRDLARSVCDSINLMPEKPRDCVPMAGDFFILNNSPNAAIIAECGFLSNAEDEKLLLDDLYRDKFAYALYVGIVDYLLK